MCIRDSYCTASTIDISENSIIFPSEKGAAIFIQLEPENENIQLNSSFSSMLQVQHVTASGIISNLLLTNNNSYLHVSNVNNEPHALILTSKYTENPSQEISLHIALYDLQGDLNGDGTIDVLDIIILVNLILFGEYNSNADLNDDGVVNILDIVIYRNIIIGN